MKLAEALITRKDLQNRLELMRNRLILNARVQEGEEPAENPEALIGEMEEISAQLESLVTQINLTNAQVLHNGLSLSAMLAHREALKQKISLLQSMLNTASDLAMRSSRSEVKLFSTVPVSQLRKKCDSLSLELRQWDTDIQSLNWTTDLL